MIFYCKPYAKATNEKRTQQSSATVLTSYGETISKPSFIIKDREKEIFLNGEVQTKRPAKSYSANGKAVKKTVICLKGLSVDTNLNLEALRNTVGQKGDM